jgi:transposase
VVTLVERRCAGLLPAIELLLEHWLHLRRSVADLTKQLKQRARRDPVCQLLMTAPGVGPLVSSAYVATIDDPGRFARSDQVGAYVGLVASIQQSGESEYRGRITREGDKLLRWLLVEAAHVLLTRSRSDSALKRWGKRIERRKGAAKAKVAVARKLAVILHRMWLSQMPFQAQPAGAAAS